MKRVLLLIIVSLLLLPQYGALGSSVFNSNSSTFPDDSKDFNIHRPTKIFFQLKYLKMN